MSWSITLTGDTDNAAEELRVLTVVRNLVEDIKANNASSVGGSFAGDHVGTHGFDSIIDTRPVPPHLGGPDVERDPVTGAPVEAQ
jgi:hypothetical protein